MGASTVGVVITCYRGDYRFAKGCCASVRYFAGEDIPICLLVDGDIDTRALERAYGVRVLRPDHVPEALHLCYGSGLSKTIALFASPFERFLHLDADAHFWGNLLDAIPTDDEWDFIYDRSVGTKAVPADRVGEWYFDPPAMKQFDPAFDHAWYRPKLFNSGVWCARRGTLDAEELLQLVRLGASAPPFFKYGDQGILNYLVLRAELQGRLQVYGVDMQAVVSDFAPEAFDQCFRVDGAGCPVVTEPRAIHYVQHKPNLFHPWFHRGRKPMDAFRLKAARDMYGLEGYAAGILLHAEDAADHLRSAGAVEGVKRVLRTVPYAFRKGLSVREAMGVESALAATADVAAGPTA